MYYKLPMLCIATFYGDTQSQVDESLAHLQQLAPELYGTTQLMKKYPNTYRTRKVKNATISLWFPFCQQYDVKINLENRISLEINPNAFDSLLDQIDHLDERRFGPLYFLNAQTKYFVSQTIAARLREYDFSQHRTTVEELLHQREKAFHHSNVGRIKGGHLRVVRG